MQDRFIRLEQAESIRSKWRQDRGGYLLRFGIRERLGGGDQIAEAPLFPRDQLPVAFIPFDDRLRTSIGQCIGRIVGRSEKDLSFVRAGIQLRNGDPGIVGQRVVFG